MGLAAQDNETSHEIQHAAQDPDPCSPYDVACVMGSRCDLSVQGPGQWTYELREYRGHKGLQPIAIFGEKVMFKFTTDKDNRKKMESEWEYGYFLGVNLSST